MRVTIIDPNRWASIQSVFCLPHRFALETKALVANSNPVPTYCVGLHCRPLTSVNHANNELYTASIAEGDNQDRTAHCLEQCGW